MQSLNTKPSINTKLSEKNKLKRSESSSLVLIFLLLLMSICMFGISRLYGFSIFPDEYGYWSAAAEVIGFDWREVTGLGMYYSYGYALILAPILYLIHDGVMAYRVALIANMLLQGTSLLLLLGIAKRFAPDIKEKYRVYAAAIAALYPVLTMYSQMTLVESLLAFLYVLLCYLSFKVFEKPGILNVSTTVLILVYMYMVHMRTIGLAAGAAAVLIFWMLSNPEKRKYILLVLSITVVGFLIAAVIKHALMSSAYSLMSQKDLATNDYDNQINIVYSNFNLSGLWRLILSLIGKIYYLCAASYGIMCIVVFEGCRALARLIKAMKRKEPSKISDWFETFILMTMLGQLMVSAVSSINPSRLDVYVYGRYTEYVVPLYLTIGILKLMRMQNPFRGLISMIPVMGLTGIITGYRMIKSGNENFHYYFCAALTYGAREISDMCDNLGRDLLLTSCLSAFVGLLIVLFIWLNRRSDNFSWIWMVIIALEIALGFKLSSENTYHLNDFSYQDYRMCQSIEDDDLPVIYALEEEWNPAVDYVQFLLRERPVHVVDTSKENSIDADTGKIKANVDEYYLLLSNDGSLMEKYQDETKLNMLGRFVLYRISEERPAAGTPGRS